MEGMCSNKQICRMCKKIEDELLDKVLEEEIEEWEGGEGGEYE